MAEQLLLDLPHRVALNRDDFLVAPSNAEAVALIDQFAVWPAPVQWLYGPAGCGKSHLAAVLAHQFEAFSVNAAQLAEAPQIAELLAGKATPEVTIIDALDELPSEAEETLFHLLNHSRHGGCCLLLLSRQPVGQLRFGLADVQSRLKAIAGVAMGHADDRLMGGLLRKLFGDRQLLIDDRVLDFLIPRIERDYAAMGRLVDIIDKAALAEQRKITVPFLVDILARHMNFIDAGLREERFLLG